MGIVLWIVQALLALAFGAHGILMLNPPPEVLAQMDFPNALRLFIGVTEVAGAIAMLLPGLVRRYVWLTPLAAAGFMLVMLLAAPYHLLRGDPPATALSNGVLFLLAAFVLWGRGRGVALSSGRRRAVRA